MPNFIECSAEYGQYKESKMYNSAINVENICSISKSKETMYYGAVLPKIRFKMVGETVECWTYSPLREKQRDKDFEMLKNI